MLHGLINNCSNGSPSLTFAVKREEYNQTCISGQLYFDGRKCTRKPCNEELPKGHIK